MFNILKNKSRVPFKKSLYIKPPEESALDSLRLSFNNVSNAQDEFILKLQSRNKYASDTTECKPVDFRKSSKIEYAKDVFMEDLSTNEQIKLGLNIFHVKVDKTTSSPIHLHESRSQLLFIVKGSIFDDVAKITFNEGDSYFISKRNAHSIKYMEGSELLVIYMPSLKIIKDEKS